MFKSVFSKYLAAFVAIILLCFSMLLFISYSIVINYATEARMQSFGELAHTVADCISERVRLDEPLQPGELDRTLLLAATGNDDLAILLTDRHGKPLSLVQNYETGFAQKPSLTDGTLMTLQQGKTVSSAPSSAPVLGSNRLVYAVPILNEQGKMDGAVAVFTPLAQWKGLISAMAKTVMMASLWIMLAALIAVYYISERVSAPLRDMRRAAKDFASGNFERRVVVRGNDEIAELGVAFNQMAQSLQNLETMRSSFMANVSHDLRTPMTTIAGFIDALRDGVIPPEKQDYYLDVISTEVHRLSRLVSSLLDVSRIQAGDRKFVKKPFDICEMGRQILISFEQKIEAKQLKIEFVCDEENMIVTADHDAIYQVFYNICDNAVKFSSDGGIFRVTIQRLAEQKNKLQVSIYNQGAGIAQEDLPFVFERFYKGDKSRGIDRKGVGLGLYICKTIMTAHGEDIWATSVQGKDCQFSFTLTEQALPRD